MKWILKLTMAWLIVLLLVDPVCAARGERHGAEPVANNGKKWRVGYAEGGPWAGYTKYLGDSIKILMKNGWFEKSEIPRMENDDAGKLWSWMAENLKSDYIELAPDAFWSSNWETPRRQKNRAAMLRRLNTGKDIDLMVAAGTWAGKDLANNEHATPTVIIQTSDPIAAGIIKSAEDSGYAHIHARCDPTRFERQIRLFHQIVKFKKLGLPYDDTEDGRSYAAVADVEKVARERGFEVIHEYIPLNEPFHKETGFLNGVKSVEALGKKGVDAIYFSANTSLDIENLPNILPVLFKYKIASFAQVSPKYVKQGLMMSISESSGEVVKFHADTMAKILNGARPGELKQVFESPNRIVLNMKNAEKIGFNVPDSAFDIADEVYTGIPTAGNPE
ncbi:MAG: ABC transporter substrate-binding protein [Desulfobacterales bacterium]|nr:ABC transporter substrate-binding protein [Desulfobacterales bacterium]